jgi:hypothetical protein
MTAREQFALLLDLAVQLRKNGSWAGETHVQKAAYVLQELLDVPAGFQFVLYKHGPFSFGLRESLNQMEAERFIELHEQPYPYGPRIGEGKAAPHLWASVKSLSAVQRKTAFVAKELGNAGVAELERIATALFLEKDSGVASKDRVQRLVELKPHVKLPEAILAFRRLEEIRAAASNFGIRSISAR